MCQAGDNVQFWPLYYTKLSPAALNIVVPNWSATLIHTSLAGAVPAQQAKMEITSIRFFMYFMIIVSSGRWSPLNPEQRDNY